MSKKTGRILAGLGLGCILIILAIAAVYHRDDSLQLVGAWRLDMVDGHRLDPQNPSGEQMTFFTLKADKTFEMPPGSGTWRVEDASLILTTTKYNGKTHAEFHADMASKYPDHPEMAKVADQVFENLKFTIGPDYASLASHMGGESWIYRKPAAPAE